MGVGNHPLQEGDETALKFCVGWSVDVVPATMSQTDFLHPPFC